MTENILARLIEHNAWANLILVEACITLTDEQLDFEPRAAVLGTIRETLTHLILSEEDYASMLATADHPLERATPPNLQELRDIASSSANRLLEMVQDLTNASLHTQVQVSDGYRVEPWVFFTQLINHATEHREQIKSIMSEQGIEPPRIDGWGYGRQQNALFDPGK